MLMNSRIIRTDTDESNCFIIIIIIIFMKWIRLFWLLYMRFRFDASCSCFPYQIDSNIKMKSWVLQLCLFLNFFYFRNFNCIQKISINSSNVLIFLILIYVWISKTRYFNASKLRFKSRQFNTTAKNLILFAIEYNIKS